MPASDMTLQMVLKLKDEASKELGKAGEAVGGLNKQALLIGGAAVAGIAAAGAALWDAAKAAGEEELGVIRLGETVKNTGADWNTAQTAIEDYLTAELKRVALDDGEGRDSLNKLTAATGDYKEAMALLPGVMDLARGANISMDQATTMVANGLAGKTAAFSKYGIEIQKGADATEILGAIQATYGGQAEAYGNTFAGAQDKMGIALGNLKETIGAAVLPALTSLISTFANLATEAMPYVEQAVGYLSDTISAVMPVIVSVIQSAVGIVKPILEAFFKFLQDPGAAMFEYLKNAITVIMPIIRDAVTNAVGAITSFWQSNGDTIKATVSGTFETAKSVVQTVMPIIQGVIATVTAAIQGDWGKVWENVKTALSDAWTAIKSVAASAVSALAGILANAWNSIWTKLNTDWNTITTSLRNTLNSWVGIFTKPVADIWDNLFGPEGAFTKMRDKLGKIFEGVHIPLPHFTVKYMNVAGLQVPSGFDVQWYGKGLENAVFTRPTLIGVGEAGAERVNVTPLGGGRSRGGGGMTLVFNYQPMMSMADEREAYTKLAPVLREVIVREQRRGVTW